MPRRSTGPHLKLEKAERDEGGRVTRHASWIIRDGKRKVRTGCRADEAEAARRKLANYLTASYSPARERNRDPDQVIIADVISVYSDDVAHRHARPKEVAARLARILDHFGERALASVTGASCRVYATARGNLGAARRELEDFRSAVRHYHREGYVNVPVAITLPQRGPARERWLTRSEAARLIWAAWRMKQSWKGQPSDRCTGQHVARFILVARAREQELSAVPP